MQKRKADFPFFWLMLILFFAFKSLNAQQRKIEHIHSDIMQRDEARYGDQLLFTGNVKFMHEQTVLTADTVIWDIDNNKIFARSNAAMNVADTISLRSYSMEYDGNIKKAFAKRNVVLKDRSQTLETQELIYDRNTNKAYFNTRSKIIQQGTVMYSNYGVYDLNSRSTFFQNSVQISTDEYDVDGSNLTFFNNGQSMKFTGPTTISSKKNPKDRVYTEEGTYNTRTKEVFLKKNSRIYSNGKILTGNDMYFNQISEFGYAKGDVELQDPKEKQTLRGGYGEVFQKQDSAMITENPYVIKAFKKDSLYISADTLIAKRDSLKNSTIDAFHKVRMFKPDIQAKCDSLNFKQSIGEMYFYQDPVFWNSYRQITGDTIVAFSDVKREKLDSIQVLGNAFAISKTDSLTTSDFNQVKGRFMLGMVDAEELRYIKVEGNAESIIYVDDEDEKKHVIERIGINKSTCGIIEADFYNREVHILECNINGDSSLYPVEMLPPNGRFLLDFAWRNKERPRQWQDIFLDIPEGNEADFSPNAKENEEIEEPEEPDEENKEEAVELIEVDSSE